MVSPDMRTRQQLLDMLGAHKAEMQERFSVASIGLFGSRIGDDARPGSDLDVLVDFARPTFDHYMELKFYLEDMFGMSVDLVLADSLKPRLRPIIEREVVYA